MDLFGETIRFSSKVNPFKNYQIAAKADMSKTFKATNWKQKYELIKGILEMKENSNCPEYYRIAISLG